MKKIVTVLAATALSVSTVGYAASGPTVFPHGISSSAPVVTPDGVTQGTIGETVTQAQGAVQKTAINAPNGVAGLDANGNVTAPLLNNSRMGGTDVGTDVSDAVVNSVSLRGAVNSCRRSDHAVFITANNTPTALSMPEQIGNFIGTGRGGLYLSLPALYKITAGSGDALNPAGSVSLGKQVVSNFSGSGIGEEFFDAYGTPNVPVASRNDGGAFSGMNGPALAASIGWVPSIMLMNINTTASGTEASISSQNLSDYNTAVSDIKNGYPSVKYVYPFYRSDANTSDWNAPSPALASAQSLIVSSGGVALDYPVGWMLANPTRIKNAIAEIQWANAHGIVTVMYLTPFSANTATDKNGNAIAQQFIYDPDFVKNIRKVISLLAAQNALPSAWVVGNYSPINTGADGSVITSNQIGADTDISAASVASAAAWVSEYAPTSSYVPLPVNSQGGQTVPCAQYVRGGVLSQPANATIAANMLPAGSLGYQDASDALLGKVTTTGDAAVGGQIYVSGGPMRVSNSFLGINYPTNSLSDIKTATSSTVIDWNYSNGNGETVIVNIRPNTATTGGVYLYDLVAGDVPSASTLIAKFLRSGVTFTAPIIANNSISANALTLTGAGAGAEIGDASTTQSYLDFHSSGSANDYDVRLSVSGGQSGVLGSGTFDITAGLIRLYGAVKLHSLSKTAILALTGVSEGTVINDSTDHVPVIYENGSWYPLQLGTALSN